MFRSRQPAFALSAISRAIRFHKSSRHEFAAIAASAALAFFMPPGKAHAQATIEGGMTQSVPGTYASPWNVGGTLTVGNAGFGVLNINAGGVVNNTLGFVGNGASGTVNVGGTGSQWNNSGALQLGIAGSGFLDILSGGLVNSAGTQAGVNANVSGTASVHGTGQWNTGGLTLGVYGTASLGIYGGGTVFSTSALVGDQYQSSGYVTADGDGTSWFVQNQLVLGRSGDAQLDVNNGAHVVAGTGASLAAYITSHAYAGVDGEHSELEVTGPLVVSSDGKAIVHVTRGGTLTSGYGVLGNGADGTGTVLVTGAGSRWNAKNDAIHVGLYGIGALDIMAGGLVRSDSAIVGVENASFGAVNIDGAGSTWHISGDINIGHYGYGQLTLSQGGLLEAGGVVNIAVSASATGVLNIGADPSSPAATPGNLTASSVVFGNGNGSINFNHTSADYVFAPAVSGMGSINQVEGTTILTGDSSGFTGATNITGGKLVVNGSLAGSAVNLAGGRLGGSGTVGGLSVGTGGVIAPGNSIGTMNVTGNISFQPGSVYEVEASAAGQSDRIAAGGSATLDGGTVRVLAGTGTYAPNTTYNILSAAGGRSGSFTDVTSNLAFLTPSLSYDPGNVFLTLSRNDISFPAVGITPNQIAAAGGIEAVGNGSSLNAAVLGLSAPQARAAYDQVSGEIHASLKTALIEDSRFLRNAANNRLRAFAAGSRDFAAWGDAWGTSGHTNGDGNAERLAQSSGGLILGGDAAWGDSWRVGVLGGFSHQSFDVAARRSSGASRNYHAGVYGGAGWGDWVLRTGLGYTRHSIGTSRDISFPVADTLKADYRAATTQFFGEFSRKFELGQGKPVWEPFANLARVSLKSGAFAEKGGAAALSGAGGTTETGFSTLGVRGSTSLAFTGASAILQGALGWRHAFGDVTPRAAVAFAGGPSFSVAGVPVARDAAVIDAGVYIKAAPQATASLTYRGQLASGMRDQSIHASLDVKF